MAYALARSPRWPSPVRPGPGFPRGRDERFPGTSPFPGVLRPGVRVRSRRGPEPGGDAPGALRENDAEFSAFWRRAWIPARPPETVPDETNGGSPPFALDVSFSAAHRTSGCDVPGKRGNPRETNPKDRRRRARPSPARRCRPPPPIRRCDTVTFGACPAVLPAGLAAIADLCPLRRRNPCHPPEVRHIPLQPLIS